MPFPNTPILDGGTSPIENPIAANWSGPYVSGTSQLQRTSTGIARTTAAGDNSYYDISTFGPDMEAYATIAVLETATNTEESDLCIRLNNGPGASASRSCYVINIRASSTASSDRMRIYRLDAGAATQLGATYTIGTIQVGDSYLIRAVGNQIEGFYNIQGTGWTSRIGPVTDNTYSSGSHIVLQMARAASRLTNFGGGSVNVESYPGSGAHSQVEGARG